MNIQKWRRYDDEYLSREKFFKGNGFY
jgi:hypothetical protein